MTGTGVAPRLLDIARHRSATWWLLSRLVIEQPLAPWLDELAGILAAVDADAATPLGLESAALLAALRDARSQADGLIALAVDRTRLLAGVMHKNDLPAPYESTAQGLSMNSDLVADVVACYAKAGLEEFARELGPPDFLGTELRFMALMAYREMQAHQARDAGLAGLWLMRQRRFLDDHLLRWVPAHCERMHALARTPFYKALCLLLSRACQIDRDDLDAVTGWTDEEHAPNTAASKVTA